MWSLSDHWCGRFLAIRKKPLRGRILDIFLTSLKITSFVDFLLLSFKSLKINRKYYNWQQRLWKRKPKEINFGFHRAIVVLMKPQKKHRRYAPISSNTNVLKSISLFNIHLNSQVQIYICLKCIFSNPLFSGIQLYSQNLWCFLYGSFYKCS